MEFYISCFTFNDGCNVWIKRDNVAVASNRDYIISKIDGGFGNGDWRFQLESFKPYFVFYADGSDPTPYRVYATDLSINDDTWHRFVITRDGTVTTNALKMYYDGVLWLESDVPTSSTITNPGALPFGLSLDSALLGFSQLRNKIIGRVFRELELIEQWGTGLNRIIETCQNQGISKPIFEEIDHYFKVSLFNDYETSQFLEKWEKEIIEYINKNNKITAKQAQKIWKVTPRTTTTRLKKMSDKGVIIEISTGPYPIFITKMLKTNFF